MSKEIEQKLHELLNDCLESQENIEIGLEDDLINVGINSITFIKLIVSIETEFNFEFDDDNLDIDKFRTLNGLVVYIKNKIE